MEGVAERRGENSVQTRKRNKQEWRNEGVKKRSEKSVQRKSGTRMLRIKSVWSHKCSLFINACLII